jgi:hypothetical protein
MSNSTTMRNTRTAGDVQQCNKAYDKGSGKSQFNKTTLFASVFRDCSKGDKRLALVPWPPCGGRA